MTKKELTNVMKLNQKLKIIQQLDFFSVNKQMAN